GLDFTVDTDGSGIVTAVNTIVDGGVNYQEGTLVRVFESGVDVVPAIFEITTVDASGTVSALTLIDGGSGYT
ncbi:MAG: hypothetical protein GWN01_01020, partial [Nitrosopumilaceae archaeon]|nr:hypothetical protein [Nitrosopumilaceae archaeon]NIX60161.1 hypothetical protein [Nitrosopumilaceae archaeon]